MTRYDLSPLYRFGVGFDGLTRMLDTVLQWDEGAPAYPPYNIEKTDETHYRIRMAIAGFSPADLTVTQQDRTLIVSGEKADANKEDAAEYLHRGIAARSFERRFQLAEHVKVTGAGLKDGLLTLTLQREVPEALKPRHIPIAGAHDGGQKVSHQAA